MSVELALSFPCAGATLIGILHLPQLPSRRALLVVTGGPQYRAGSHRQFVLLARRLAECGVAVMRFDYRGMGDSEGAPRDFRDIGPDTRAAIQALFDAVPQVQELVLWGLCDGATAAAFYAPQDARICGLILLNPWTRTELGAARIALRHYYGRRLTQAEFWRKLLTGGFLWRAALASLFGSCRSALGFSAVDDLAEDLPARLHRALNAFQGRIFVILSGDDYTAREFAALQSQHIEWSRLMNDSRVRQTVLPQANHTFSRAIWRDEVASMCEEWIKSW